MSEGMNLVVVCGNLGAAPDLRFTQGGQAVLNMRIAVNERYQDRDKEWKERVEWVPVTVWGKRAEALGKILDKGSSVLVTGSLRTTSYEKDGDKRWKTDVIAREVILTGGRGRGTGNSDEPAPNTQRAAQRGGQRGHTPAGGGGFGGQRAPQRQGTYDEHASEFSGSPPQDDDIPFVADSISHDIRRWGL